MKKELLLAMILVGAGASAAGANTVRYYTGHECQAENQHASYVDYWSAGCVNESSTCGQTAAVRLPISGNNSNTVDIDGVSVYVYDGSDDAQISCGIALVNSSGTTYTSTTRGSGTATTGFATITWTGAQLPNGGASVSNVQSYNVGCTIPSLVIMDPVTLVCVTGAYSTITGYQVDQVNP